MAVINLTSANFDEVTKGKKVLVDFWATWCGPCKMVSPIIDAIAEEEGHDFIVAKVNVDEENELARKFKVMSIPTLMVLRDGEQAAVAVGAQPKEAILKFAEEA